LFVAMVYHASTSNWDSKVIFRPNGTLRFVLMCVVLAHLW
jgi:hypothetical protein